MKTVNYFRKYSTLVVCQGSEYISIARSTGDLISILAGYFAKR